MGRAIKKRKLDKTVEAVENSSNENKQDEYFIEDIWHVKIVRMKRKNDYDMEFQVKWDDWSDTQNVSTSIIIEELKISYT